MPLKLDIFNETFTKGSAFMKVIDLLHKRLFSFFHKTSRLNLLHIVCNEDTTFV